MANADASKPYFYSRRHPAPVGSPVGSNHAYDVYDFDFKDGEMVIVKTGERDPNADIQAAKSETLQELMARMPGKTPLAKVASAVESGLAPYDNDGSYKDVTGVPGSIVEQQELMRKAKAQAAAMPKDLLDSDKKFTDMLSDVDEAKILKWIQSNFPKKTEPAPAQEDVKQ